MLIVRLLPLPSIALVVLAAKSLQVTEPTPGREMVGEFTQSSNSACPMAQPRMGSGVEHFGKSLLGCDVS